MVGSIVLRLIAMMLVLTGLLILGFVNFFLLPIGIAIIIVLKFLGHGLIQ